jgi:photosystem II stability/assembly factor-like uncharacterized protein
MVMFARVAWSGCGRLVILQLAPCLLIGCAHDGGNGGAGQGVRDMARVVRACPSVSSTWEEITPPGFIGGDALALDPFEDGTLWLGEAPAMTTSDGGMGPAGLFKSTDCGATWAHVNTGMNGDAIDGASIWSLAIDYVDRGTIYVVGAYGPQGLWKSTNGGVDWVQLFPPDSEFAKTVPYNWVGSVSMDPRDHLHLVVGTHDNCNPPYDPACQAETRDGGATWHIVKVPGKSWSEQAGPYVLNDTSWLFTVLFDGMYLTTDNGATFKQVAPAGVVGATGGEFTHRPYAAASDNNYYMPTINSGILKSVDGAKSWSVIPNSGTGYQLGFALGSTHLYSGDFNNGTYQMGALPGADSWSPLPAPPPRRTSSRMTGSESMEYDESHHILYSANFDGGVWRMVTQ